MNKPLLRTRLLSVMRSAVLPNRVLNSVAPLRLVVMAEANLNRPYSGKFNVRSVRVAQPSNRRRLTIMFPGILAELEANSMQVVLSVRALNVAIEVVEFGVDADRSMCRIAVMGSGRLRYRLTRLLVINSSVVLVRLSTRVRCVIGYRVLSGRQVVLTC